MTRPELAESPDATHYEVRIMNATKPATNEASLESSLRSTLDRLFTGPLRPKITHQTVPAPLRTPRGEGRRRDSC